MNNKYTGHSGLRAIPVAALVLCAIAGSWPAAAQAQPGRNDDPRQALDVAQVPLFLTRSEAPIAVIDLPKDQSLFKKAYNDYSDLDGDGQLETTYEDSIDYYGYFDAELCYRHANGVFEPAAASAGANGHYCSGDWSGNFLNWVAMSRMDILRKILYGGKRSVDTADTTVLGRAFLPPDAHAWAKYYNGSDIAQLTPFSDIATRAPGTITYREETVPTQEDFANFDVSGYPQCGSGRFVAKRFTIFNPGIFSVGDQVRIETLRGSGMIGGVCAIDGNDVVFRIDPQDFETPGQSGYIWTFENMSRTGISFCNVTPGTGMSQNVTAAPLMRVAQGNYELWGASEGWQCRWREESNSSQGSFEGGFRSNGNRAALSGLNASAENPSQSKNGLGEYNVRVQACAPGLVSQQTCKQYPDGNYKPAGLLQRYGDDGDMHFALFTGSYNNNYSGGVLRANAASFAQEVNVNGNGTFTANAHIVNTIDKLRIYGFSYDTSNHYGSGDNCTYQLTNPRSNPGEGSCRSWGNPVGEIYLESLRYLAGQSPTRAFVPNSTVMGLRVATWEDPLNEQNYCSPLNVLAFNTSVNTHDEDQMDGVADLGAPQSAATLTNELGNYEGINGRSWFVGNAGADSTGLCTAKTVSGLGDVTGICPAAPSLSGSYLMAGTAWYARTHRIRHDLNVPAEDKKSLKVNTFGVQLASNVPRIEVEVGGRNVTILPAYRLNLPNGTSGTGALVNFKVIESTPEKGSFYINWEDSNQGGDFDQDVWGVLEYTVSGNRITVTTDTISASTTNPQGFGYTISGTDADGPHFTSGIYGFTYDDPTLVAGCSNCELEDEPASVTYTVGSTAAGKLEDPLYYAAKWGGFKDGNDNGRPDEPAEWDADGDGQPDHYFYATNPLGLEAALDDALSGVALTRSSAASVAASSTRLQSGTHVYQATFSSVDWHGDLLAYELDNTTGELSDAASPTWRAGEQLPDAAARNIVTWADGDGADFLWYELTPEQQLALARPTAGLSRDLVEAIRNGGASLPTAAAGEGRDRLAYIRGDRANEGRGKKYRVRNKDTVLGDIVNSNPAYVGTQDFNYAASSDVPGSGSYASYVTDKASRTPMIYVGANDGMLHGFDATSGRERLAYAPLSVYPKLSALTGKGYNNRHHYLVDGSSAAVDAFIGGSWGTYMVGTTGGGGKDIFALDVSDPDNFDKDDVLWEFSTTRLSAQGVDITLRTPEPRSQGYDAEHFENLGYSVPAPAAVLLHNGRWAAIVANGYGSTSGTAALFIIDLETGDLIRALDTGYTNGGNGLSTPFPVDVDGDRVMDYVYAGDMQGNLWKFDLTGSNPNQWRIAGGQGNQREPLFVACANPNDCDDTRQPITAQPEVGAYPGGGVMVYFGTGSFFADSDRSNNQTQSFYGIRDRAVVIGDASASNNTGRVERHGLIQQEFVTQAAGTQSAGIDEAGNPGTGSGETVRLASDYTVDDDDDGWVIDLPLSGERQVSAPSLSRGRIIFTTLIPNSNPCGSGGTSFLVAIDAFSGGRLDFSPFDINHDQNFDDKDRTEHNRETVYASAIESQVGIVGSPTLITLSPTEERAILSGSDGELRNVLINPGPGGGPQSWRQLR